MIEPADDEARLWRSLIDHSLGLICAHTPDGTLLAINLAAAELLGYTPEELIGHNLRDMVEEPQRSRFDAYLARLARDGAAQGYLRMTARSGERLTWAYRNRLHREAGKDPVVLGYAQNVTRRLDLDRKLQETNERYRRLFDEAPVAYHEIDQTGAVVRVNQAECELLLQTKDDLLGMPVWKLVAPESEDVSHRSVLSKLSGDQPLTPFFREYVRRDGKRLLLNIHENLIRSATGEIVGIRSAMLDVTEQFRAERELRRLNAELDSRVVERTFELNASHDRMREFVYTVSHDLQEPLRSIGSFAKLLKTRYTGRLDPEGVEFLDFVVSGAARMAGLVQDLLAYSHVLHDEDSVEPISLRQIADVAVANLSTSITKSGAGITFGELPEVYANPNRLVQLLQNLVSNAIKYRSEAAPAIRIDASGGGSSVTDNGIGIPEEDHQRVFGLFKRSGRGITPGSGVGLAICQAIVERHGGRIWVESPPQGGSAFLFTLPVSPVARPPHAEMEA